MTDLFVALGLVLVIEGLLWAAFPGIARTLVEIASQRPEINNRISGLIAAGVGVFIVWMVRG